jgi:spermidine synthase
MKMATALIAIGFSSIIVQILLLRELVTAFNGNELTYGISLMIWLLSGSLGSFIAGKSAARIKSPFQALIMTELAISLIVPAELFFARLSKPFFGIPVGAIPDLNSIFLISLLTIFPLSFLFAYLFTLGSKALKDIGSMYIIESLGAVIGGAAFTFLLIYFLDPFQIAGVTGFILSFSALHIYKYFVRKDIRAKIPVMIIFSFVLAVNLILVHPIGQRIDRYSSRIQWKGLNLVNSIDSVYGRISVIEDHGSYSYFESGSLMFSTASIAENEELVHLSFIEARSPKSVLLIGGGLGGVNQEILKYDLKKFDYVEFDPKLAALANPLFQSIITDGRHFIKSSKQNYDLIIINVGDPTNASLNRFYTYEFMLSCRKRLARGGVLALKLSASEAFMRKELKELNSSVYKTLNLVFPHTIVIPGNYNYFYATDSKGILTDNASEMMKRWEEMKVPTSYFNELSIPHIMQSFKLKYMLDAIHFDTSTKVNTDFHPISYLYGLLVWLSYFPGIISMQLQKLLDIKFAALVFWSLALSLTYKFASTRSGPIKSSILPLVVCLIGFCAMILQLLVIYSFQALYGNIYSEIGLLIAIFMGGLAFGSYLTNKKYPDINISAVIASLLTLIAIFMTYLILTPKLPYQLSQYLIPAFSFLFAMLVGAVFPVAARSYQAKSLENKAGILYASDLFGGSIAAMLTSIWFLPVFGIIGTCALALVLDMASLILIFPLHEKRPL